MPEIVTGKIKAADGVTNLNFRLVKPVGLDETKKYPTIVYGVMHRDFLVSFSGVDFPCVDRGFAREQSVQVVVRPEDIEVVSPVEGQLVGVVNDVIFKGVHFEMHVECEGREWLIHSTRACTPGETIGMRIGPNEIHIMARSEG